MSSETVKYGVAYCSFAIVMSVNSSSWLAAALPYNLYILGSFLTSASVLFVLTHNLPAQAAHPERRERSRDYICTSLLKCVININFGTTGLVSETVVH